MDKNISSPPPEDPFFCKASCSHNSPNTSLTFPHTVPPYGASHLPKVHLLPSAEPSATHNAAKPVLALISTYKAPPLLPCPLACCTAPAFHSASSYPQSPQALTEPPLACRVPNILFSLTLMLMYFFLQLITDFRVFCSFTDH